MNVSKSICWARFNDNSWIPPASLTWNRFLGAFEVFSLGAFSKISLYMLLFFCSCLRGFAVFHLSGVAATVTVHIFPLRQNNNNNVVRAISYFDWPVWGTLLLSWSTNQIWVILDQLKIEHELRPSLWLRSRTAQRSSYHQLRSCDYRRYSGAVFSRDG